MRQLGRHQHQQSHRRPGARPGGGCKTQRGDGGGHFQPAVRAQAQEPLSLLPEENNLHHHADGPQRTHRRLAITQRHEVQRQEGIQAGMGQHGEKHRGKKPGHIGPAQQRQHGRRGVFMRRVLVGGGQPHGGGQQQGVHASHEERKDANAHALQQRTKGRDRDDEADRAPHAHAAITRRVYALRGVQELRQQRFMQRHNAAVGQKQQHRHQRHRQSRCDTQQARGRQQRAGGGNAYQLGAPATVVSRPAPRIGREDPRPGLQRRDTADEQR